MTDSASVSKPEDSGQSNLNRAARRRAARGDMNNPLSEEQQREQVREAGKGLAQLFKGREQPYTPVTKSLDQIGLEPRIMDVMIGEEPVQCFVIPCQELVYKEWQHMTGAQYTSTANGEAAGE